MPTPSGRRFVPLGSSPPPQPSTSVPAGVAPLTEPRVALPLEPARRPPVANRVREARLAEASFERGVRRGRLEMGTLWGGWEGLRRTAGAELDLDALQREFPWLPDELVAILREVIAPVRPPPVSPPVPETVVDVSGWDGNPYVPG